MGLGFGSFKESSQLKNNRRIEAEVRGIDYDAQLAKEKEENRAKRRQKRKQRYGNQYESSDDDDEEEEHENENKKKHSRSSAIPSTDDLLSKQSWKAKRGKKQKRSNLPKIIPYQELIKKQKQSGSEKVVIIDMRGPSSGTTTPKTTSSLSSKVPLGEELLYNLSFLLGTYENKLHSSSRHHETSILRTIRGLENQISDAEDRSKKARDRRDKLAKAHEIAESVRNEISSTLQKSTTQKRQRVTQLVSELKDVFTASERKELQFWNILAPTLLGPTMQIMLENWKPFFGGIESSAGNRTRDRAVVDSFFEWGFSSDNNREGRILCESMVKNQLIPNLKADIESQALGVWDPVTNPYAVLDLYEYIRTKALAFDKEDSIPTSGAIQNEDDPNQVFPSHRGDDPAEDVEREFSSNLTEHIRDKLIRDAVYPKLLAAISNWKPTVSGEVSKRELKHPLHSWVLPWLPHIDHPILLPNILVECKRKLKQALSVMQRGRMSKMDCFNIPSILDILRPWCAILDSKSLQKLMSEHTDLFSKYENILTVALAGDPIDGNDWKSLRHLLFDLHSNRLLSDIDFLSLFECFLDGWASHLHFFLIGGNKVLLPLNDDYEEPKNPDVLESAVNAYKECKIRVLVDPFYGIKARSLSCSRSLKLLRGDSYTCRYFYSVARMIQIYHQSQTLSPEELANKLDFIGPQQAFNTIRKRRLLEEREQSRAAQVGESREESRAKAVLRKRNILEPTFREVVEAFASDCGVIFRPKSGAEKDGKPIYLFGNKVIYIEGDVVFSQDGNNKNVSWRPISLDKLGTMVS